MEPNKNGEEVKVTPPAPTPDAKGEDQDVDFDKELESLENNGAPAPATPPRKSKEEELRQAVFTGKKIAARVKELGGDPSAIIAEEAPVEPVAPPPIDTSNFVTKSDLAQAEARKITKSEGEFKVVMWYVNNKGLSVEEAHLLANKNRLKKSLSEATRTRETIASPGGGGPGADRPIDTEAPQLSPELAQRVMSSGMIYDPVKKAYVGKKFQLRYDSTRKEFVNERIPKSQ